MKLLIRKYLNEKNHSCFLYFNCDLLDRKQDLVSIVETYLEQFPSAERRYLLLDEVDFIAGDALIEVKYKNKVVQEDEQPLKRFSGKKVLITKRQWKTHGDVSYVPVEYFLLNQGTTCY